MYTEDTIEIYDPKFDDVVFKTIFAEDKNEAITKKFLNDITGMDIKENEKLEFKTTEIRSSKYLLNQKRPNVIIHIEIVRENKNKKDTEEESNSETENRR